MGATEKMVKCLLISGSLIGSMAMNLSCQSKKIVGERAGQGKIGEELNPPPSREVKTPENTPSLELEEDLAIKDLQPRVGVRDFEEINRTYAVLTGVSLADVRDVFLRLKASLPGSNNPAELSGATINAAKELAANYCDIMSKDVTLRAVFTGVNFDLPPAQAYADVRMFAGQVIDRFWGTGLDHLPNREISVEIMAELVTDLITNNPGADKTPGILMGACMTALSASPVLMK